MNAAADSTMRGFPAYPEVRDGQVPPIIESRYDQMFPASVGESTQMIATLHSFLAEDEDRPLSHQG
jgi:hypothetical protein